MIVITSKEHRACIAITRYIARKPRFACNKHSPFVNFPESPLSRVTGRCA